MSSNQDPGHIETEPARKERRHRRTLLLRRLLLPAVVACTVVLALGPDVVGSSNFLDFLAHAGAYAAVALAAMTWPSRRAGSFSSDAVRTIAVAAFSVGIEQLQRFVGRDPQVGDIGANVIGLVAAFIVTRCFRAMARSRRSRSA